MNPHEMFQEMARYNSWMNERLYEACADMSDDERKLDMKAFFRSIHGTLNHILLADRVWLGRLSGQPFAVRSLEQELYTDFAVLACERKKTDAEIERVVSSFGPSELNGSITYRSISQQKQTSASRSLILMHLFNHQTHHRGQVTSLMSQLGRDVGVTDLIALPAP